MTVRFEWDEEKNRTNSQKHSGITFELAALVFDDPQYLVIEDRVVDGEQRWHAIGVARNAVLVVVHVYRRESKNEEETIRIISAREASKRERRRYFQQAAYEE